MLILKRTVLFLGLAARWVKTWWFCQAFGIWLEVSFYCRAFEWVYESICNSIGLLKVVLLHVTCLGNICFKRECRNGAGHFLEAKQVGGMGDVHVFLGSMMKEMCKIHSKHNKYILQFYETRKNYILIRIQWEPLVFEEGNMVFPSDPFLILVAAFIAVLYFYLLL